MNLATNLTRRNRILSRLRKAEVSPLSEPELMHVVTDDTLGYQPTYWQDLEKNLVAAHAQVITAGPRHWRQHVAEICQIKGIKHLLLPGMPPLAGGDRQMPAPTTWMQAWQGGPELSTFDREIEHFKDSLFNEVDAGLTIAESAIADTGTLVIRSSAWQPRTLSLVPPIHICLLDARCLYPNLATAMHIEGWASNMPSNLIFVSGPSKTADIQQTLAYGAHGPKQLIVILVAGEIR